MRCVSGNRQGGEHTLQLPPRPERTPLCHMHRLVALPPHHRIVKVESWLDVGNRTTAGKASSTRSPRRDSVRDERA